MKIITDTQKNGVVILDDDNNYVTATTLANFGQVISDSSSSFDSGFMPQNESGLLSFRKAGDFVQIAYQVDKGFHTVKWGGYENDSSAEVVNLAHPYKVWIADFYKNRLVGLRHFVAPEPIFDLSDPLYHIPLPNTNCSGYNGTSVGWVCLYQTGNVDLISVQDKIQCAYERESGLHEPYNNANMSSTDGPRFYARNNINFYASPSSWIQKTQEENSANWVLDPAHLIQIKTANNTMSTEHDEKGEVYTFDRALNEKYYPYYPNRLSAIQKAFYEKGWRNNAGGVSDFSPQVLSKLTAVEPPKELNVSEMISDLIPSNKKVLDFDSWTPDIRSFLSKKIFSFKTTCCVCNSIDFDVEKNISDYEIVPFFLSYIDFSLKKEDFPKQDNTGNSFLSPKINIYSEDLSEAIDQKHLRLYPYNINEFMLDLASDFDNESENEDAENPFYDLPNLSYSFHVCNSCSKLYSFNTLFVSDNGIDTFVTKRVFNKKGFNQFLANNDDVAIVWEAYHTAISEGYLSHRDFSSYGTSTNRFSSNQFIVPETYTISCLNCNYVELIKITDNKLIIPKEYSAVCNFDDSLPTTYMCAIEINNCSNCSTILETQLPKELFISAGNKPQSFIDFGYIPSITHSSSFKISNTLDNLLKLEILNTANIHNNIIPTIIRLEDLTEYYYAIVYIEGVPYLAIDKLPNFNEKTTLCEDCATLHLNQNSCFNCKMKGIIKMPEINIILDTESEF